MDIFELAKLVDVNIYLTLDEFDEYRKRNKVQLSNREIQESIIKSKIKDIKDELWEWKND